ncbi:cucumber peeling cupredoxin isoform X1 [Lathyrus oleraceus]|uniref:cucumber peeling cupredoxin isoform X3 n=1 Tax=Pisum sativum TaxID=3888 RepID=UPI0021D38FA0|nr:cucumber peeling cupredoxin-like isoform X3 [Pisum sativum]XP_050902429.1 cucumber peeling cupredoxin-like isoform X1 [Pisum sativum]
MSQLRNMSIILVVFAFVATILERTEAADHTVGDSTGWTSSAGAKFYSDWASNNTFKQNDVLVFNFFAGAHTVAATNKADFDNCNVNQNTNDIITTSPARVTLNRTGDFYFICTVSSHCQSGGQKLTIKVPTSSSSTPPSSTPPSPTPPSSTPPSPTPPSSGTTPTPPTSGGTPSPSSPTQPDATPPSPGSATAIVATFPALIAIVINLLV